MNEHLWQSTFYVVFYNSILRHSCFNIEKITWSFWSINSVLDTVLTLRIVIFFD